MPKLGVNVDHIATLREARKGLFPDPVVAAVICEDAGCDSIVAHLREDRRHINDNDIERLRKTVRTRFNLEMSLSQEIIDIACLLKPHQVTLVPEKREELTTEGGLDVVLNKDRLREAINKFTNCAIGVSLFIDPDKKQIEEACELGVKMIELHTGKYTCAKTNLEAIQRLKEIVEAVNFGKTLGLTVNAGHGLDYNNVNAIAKIGGIEELNIGYSIICRSVFVGLKEAVLECVRMVR